MNHDQLMFIVFLFGAVVVLGTVMIVCAGIVRSRRLRLQRNGPGSPRVPVPAGAWQRFGPALAAMYARHEWHDTRGARRTVSAEQTYFGYACAYSLPMLRRSLAADWRVRNPDQARERSRDAVGLAAADAAAIAGARGEGPEALEARLLAAGAPADVARFIASAVPVDARFEGDEAEHLSALAFNLGRFANLVRWCGSAGFLDHDEVREASDVLGAAAVTAFEGWASFGDHYIAGLRAYTRRGNRPFVKAVEWLSADPSSPWRALPWPAAR